MLVSPGTTITRDEWTRACGLPSDFDMASTFELAEAPGYHDSEAQLHSVATQNAYRHVLVVGEAVVRQYHLGGVQPLRWHPRNTSVQAHAVSLLTPASWDWKLATLLWPCTRPELADLVKELVE